MPDAIALDAFPRRADAVTTEEQAPGLAAVYAPAAGRVLLTNDVGLLVLDRCDGSRDVAAVVDGVRAAYPDVTAEQAAADVRAFLRAAAEKGVVTWA